MAQTRTGHWVMARIGRWHAGLAAAVIILVEVIESFVAITDLCIKNAIT